MHASVAEYVADAVRRYELADRATLDVGSYDVNGTSRHLFTGSYLGVDARPGPGVDAVCDAEALPYTDASYEVVVCTEMLEHCRRPWLAVDEMARVLVVGGYLILTARGYDERGCFPVHDFPADFWRFSTWGMELLMRDAGLTVHTCKKDPESPGVLLTAEKR